MRAVSGQEATFIWAETLAWHMHARAMAVPQHEPHRQVVREAIEHRVREQPDGRDRLLAAREGHPGAPASGPRISAIASASHSRPSVTR